MHFNDIFTYMTGIVVHGGAFALSIEEQAPSEQGVRKAANAGMGVLCQGGSALNAVEAAVRDMEANPVFNAGLGSSLTRDKRIEVDASIMDGKTKQFGAVASVPDFLHPVVLARAVMDDGEHAFLCGQGALQFAREKGLSEWQKTHMITDGASRRLQRWRARRDPLFSKSCDTVGACALDSEGTLAVAVSTGGTTGKRPGRIGDSPVIGAGFYADNILGAACATGTGEAIMRVLLCYRAVCKAGQNLAPDIITQEAMTILDHETGKQGGIIFLAPNGDFALNHNTPHMPWAAVSGQTNMKSGISREKSTIS